MKRLNVRFTLATAFVLWTAIAAAQTGISVTINGETVPFAGMGPQMVGGRFLVPLRGIFEKLGAAVQWHPDRREVIATRGQDTVDLMIGNPNATVNGQSVTLDVPAQIVNGSTMVPVRFVSEAMGAQVNWREAEQIVVITSNQGASTQQPAESPQEKSTGDGPVRMARISLIEGGAAWRPGDDVDWSDAATNLPLRQGAQIWLNPGSRAEVQFDDGSFLRLGNGAIATLFTMFADDRGEFTEIRLNSGTATLRLTNSASSYQVDTPLASITSAGLSDLRIDATNGLGVVVWTGEAQVQGDPGQKAVGAVQFLGLNPGDTAYAANDAPDKDDWDNFCDRRDQVELHPSPNLPSSIALVGGDLDTFGTWVRDPQYGYCWHPTNTDPNWAPYQNGHWVWVSPFGWTWCGNEPWGWAPYHYGTWFYSPAGWLWRPGPAQQYWSPAVVHFSTRNGNIAWCALAPSEVRYPSAVVVGFRSGNWAANFSIGGAASYYPDGPDHCTPHPWTNTVINHTTNVYNVTRITNVQNVYVSNNGFVPRNSHVPGAATVTTVGEFSGRGKFTRGTASSIAIFASGQTFAPPSAGSARYAGPTNVKPTAASFSPARTLTKARPDPGIANRTVVRAPLPPRTVASSPTMPSSRILPVTTSNPTRTENPNGSKTKTTKPDVTSPAKSSTGTSTKPTDPRQRTSAPKKNDKKPPKKSKDKKDGG